MLEEVRDRDIAIKTLRRQKKKKQNDNAIASSASDDTTVINRKTQLIEPEIQTVATTTEPFPERLSEAEVEEVKPMARDNRNWAAGIVCRAVRAFEIPCD